MKTNPLMLRFAESREKLSKDPFRPIYHYVNPEGRLNDPNGLSYWQGRWHLFYQAYPPEDTRQHWGHAVSDDLIHWRDLPYAIYPNPERACFSGSALVEDNRVIAMYHGTMVGNMVAVSDDPLLLNWEKVTGQAVIPMERDVMTDGQTGWPLRYRVFDPCIWEEEGVYYSLSAGYRPDGPDNKLVRSNPLFRSKDLIEWEYLHEFVEGDEYYTLVGDDGACPYFWPIGDKYILPFYSHMSGGQYLLGDYDKIRDKFVVTSHGRFNFGKSGPGGVHAPSATPCPEGTGDVIIIFNMNPALATKGWNQIMTLPRRLTLVSRNQIGIEPAGNLEALRHSHVSQPAIKLPANQEIVFNQVSGNAMEVNVEFDPKDAQTIELNMLRSPNKEEFTRIIFYKDKGLRRDREYMAIREESKEYSGSNSLISIETLNSSLLEDVQVRPPETAPFFLAPGEKVNLRIFVDKSVIEVFVNGKQAVATRVYPSRNDSKGVSIKAYGKDAELISLDAWQMKSIYE